MAMAIILIIFAVLLLVIFNIFSIEHRKTTHQHPQKNRSHLPHQQENPYHAVSIEFGSNACSVVQTIKDKYFLTNEAPLIPLQGCGSTGCHCKYKHHDDRRHTIRRPQTLSSSIAYEATGKIDRRVKKGRRSTD